MRYRLAALLATAGVLASAALAAATALAPPPGALLATSQPIFSWTLPTNEQSEALYIAGKPDRTLEGRFYDENVVAAGIFTHDERQWSPTAPLYAGHYWWLVRSSDRNTLQSFYSTPTDFTILVSLTLLPVETVRFTFLHLLDLRVRWRANVHGLTVRVRLLRRGRVIWRQTASEFNLIGSPGSTGFGWYRPRRIKQGTRLTLQVSLLANGGKKTRTLVVRAP